MTNDRRHKQFCSGVANGSSCYRPYEDLQELNHWVNKSSVHEGQTFEVGHFNDYEEYWWFHGELIKKPKMNIVPFDYNTWINGGYKAVTRSGLSVDITGGSIAKNEVYGIVEGRSGTLTFDWKGKTKKTYHSEMSCEYDLFMIKKETDMNTVPFDYSLIEKGYTVQTKSGKKVLQLFLFDKIKSAFRLFVFLEDGESVLKYRTQGKYYTDNSSEHDLVMVPPVYTKYIVVFPEKSFIYDNFEIAKDAASDGFVCLLKVTYQGNEIIFKEILK